MQAAMEIRVVETRLRRIRIEQPESLRRPSAKDSGFPVFQGMLAVSFLSSIVSLSILFHIFNSLKGF